MFLTKEDERTLTGEKGEAHRRLMEMLVALGDLFQAEQLVPIRSAQVSGVSYKTIGEWGLKWLRTLADGDCKVTVPTTLNPAGMDLRLWKEMGIPEGFASKQLDVVKAYEALGITCSCTCTPYLHVNIPSKGDHIAWAESSAVCYANSVIGARTNREGGPSALAAAIIGKTPGYGLHNDEGRVPGMMFEVGPGVSDLSALGYLMGRSSKGKVPFIKGIKPDPEGLKAMCAAMAASGSTALFHVKDVTPEAAWAEKAIAGPKGKGLETIAITASDVKETATALSTATGRKAIGLVAIGCPHCTPSELKEVASILRGIRKKMAKAPDAGVKLWVCTSREAAEAASKAVAEIRAYGLVVNDTCMVVAPLECLFKRTATNSSKAAHYMAMDSFGNQKVVYGDLKYVLGLLWTSKGRRR